jgi:hypothetical protein
MARQNGGRNYPPDPDLREALRVLRRGLGKDQVIVLATIRHNDPVAKARVAAPYAQTCLELEVDVGAAGGLSAGRARRAGQRIDLQA